MAQLTVRQEIGCPKFPSSSCDGTGGASKGSQLVNPRGWFPGPRERPAERAGWNTKVWSKGHMKESIGRFLVIGAVAIVTLWLSLGAVGCSSDSSSSTEPAVEDPPINPPPSSNPHKPPPTQEQPGWDEVEDS